MQEYKIKPADCYVADVYGGDIRVITTRHGGEFYQTIQGQFMSEESLLSCNEKTRTLYDGKTLTVNKNQISIV